MSLRDEGFAIIAGLFNRQHMSSIALELQCSSLQRSRAGCRNAFQLSCVQELANDASVLNLAREVLGSEAKPYRATLFDKSPQSNWLVVWHQDTALPLRRRVDVRGWGPWSVKDGMICAHAPSAALEQILAIRVHLDDSNGDNGPLKVLPRTHILGLLSDDAILDLRSRVPEFECHARVGDVILMRPLLVHSSSKSKTNGAARRVLHIEYSAQSLFPGGLELSACEGIKC